MTRIVCGFCAAATDDAKSCVNCRHDPVLPYTQRNETPVRSSRLGEARRALGPRASVEQIAEHQGVDPRTVRRWLSADVRPAS